MRCQEWSKSVEQSWAFLFTDYGFEILSCKEGTHDSAILFAESSFCRIRFKIIAEFNEYNVDFGTVDAPLDWTSNDDMSLQGKPTVWYSLLGILAYLERRSPSRDELIKSARETYKRRHDPSNALSMIELLARRAKPHINQILSFFSRENFESFSDDYARYWGRR